MSFTDSHSNMPDIAPGGKRVLIVTTGPKAPPVYSIANGMTVVTDLTGAGYPFDVMTYERFVDIPFNASDNHDIIFLNGHTSPVKSHQIAAKCRNAIQTGRKIFINGHLPYTCHPKSTNHPHGKIFSEDLFNLTCRPAWGYGKIVVPKSFEKDPVITRAFQRPHRIHSFSFQHSPEITVTMAGHIVGFLTPMGGAIDGASDYLLNALDYGKVTAYLRYGHAEIIGFANDRVEGRPIFSLEVHCDLSSNIKAIDALEEMADDMQILLTNLLVLDRCTDNGDRRWNEAAENPLMLLGSHSRSHPHFWPDVSDFHGETAGALEEQRQTIPKTSHYFNFSGRMNPTRQQLEALRDSGVICGGQGHTPRMVGRPFSAPWQQYKNAPFRRWIWRILHRLIPPREIQLMPTCKEWFAVMAASHRLPYQLSQTIWSDYKALRGNQSYVKLLKHAFAQNLKNGLYSFGGIHDYCMDKSLQKFNTNGIHLKDQITAAMAFLKSQDVIFISTEHLVNRLNDFIKGWIDYEKISDNRLRVIVHREAALANQVKVEKRGNRVPVAKGDCVVSQKRVDRLLYVDLVPEVESRFEVTFERQSPNTRRV